MLLSGTRGKNDVEEHGRWQGLQLYNLFLSREAGNCFAMAPHQKYDYALFKNSFIHHFIYPTMARRGTRFTHAAARIHQMLPHTFTANRISSKFAKHNHRMPLKCGIKASMPWAYHSYNSNIWKKNTSFPPSNRHLLTIITRTQPWKLEGKHVKECQSILA